MSGLSISEIFWGGPSPITLTGCSKEKGGQGSKPLILSGAKFADAWDKTGTEKCGEKDLVLNDVESKTTSISLWENVARKVYEQVGYTGNYESYKALNPYQQEYAVAKLTDKLKANFKGKKLSNIHSSISHRAYCFTHDFPLLPTNGQLFPNSIDLGVTADEVAKILEEAKGAQVRAVAKIGDVVQTLPIPAEVGDTLQFTIRITPAKFESAFNYDEAVSLPYKKDGKYLIDLGPGVEVIGQAVEDEEDGRNLEITARIKITEKAKICGLSERFLAIKFREKSGAEYKLPLPPGMTAFLEIGGERKTDFHKIAPSRGKQDTSPGFTITGKGIPTEEIEVSFGDGIEVEITAVSETKIHGQMIIDPDATKGPRTVVIKHKGEVISSKLRFMVTEKAKERGPAPTSAVTDLKVLSSTTNSCTLGWSAVTGASYYGVFQVRRRIARPTETKATIAGLTPDKKHTFTIKPGHNRAYGPKKTVECKTKKKQIIYDYSKKTLLAKCGEIKQKNQAFGGNCAGKVKSGKWTGKAGAQAINNIIFKFNKRSGWGLKPIPVGK